MKIGSKKREIVIVAAVAVIMTLFLLYRIITGMADTEASADRIPETIADNSAGNSDNDAGIISQQPSLDVQVVREIEKIGDALEKGVTAGKPYKGELVEEGSKNILIMGEDKVSYLNDTIGIVSISQKTHKVKIIMLPRDTYIEYNDQVRDALEKAGRLHLPGVFKINYAHQIGMLLKYEGKFDKPAASFLAQVVKEKFGVDPDEYVKINTKGFTEIVDIFGGVEIKVPYTMNYDDPVQELSIHLEKGTKRLYGKEAEGFVRFRQGFDENGKFFEIGDSGRKANQIAFLKAFLKQHGTIKNVDKLPKVLDALGKNLQHSIGLGDMFLTYSKIAKDVIADKYEIESVNIDGKSQMIENASYIVVDSGD